VAFSPDGKTLAAGYQAVGGGGVVLYDVAGRRRLGEPLAVTEGFVTAVAFSPDGKTLAVGYQAAVAAAAGWCCTTSPGGAGWASRWR
jgi:WD40 repeat protein